MASRALRWFMDIVCAGGTYVAPPPVGVPSNAVYTIGGDPIQLISGGYWTTI